jgi:hypothetical protein
MFWMVALVLAGIVGAVMAGGWFQSGPVLAAQGTNGEAQLDLVVSVPTDICPDGSRCVTIGDTLDAIRSLRGFSVDSFFDIQYVRVYSNGEPGTLGGARFSVDSLFDVAIFGDPDFDLFGDPDFDIVSISALGTLTDPSNPGNVLDEVDQVLKGHKHNGHVTVLK